MDRFEVLIIDDISYVPYEKEEMDVLFYCSLNGMSKEVQ
jgi:DNA replication protein DnaC